MLKFLRRLNALFHRRRLERELEDDMVAHREMMPPDRQRNFGSSLQLREEAGDQWGWTWLDHLRQDLAYGARSLRRSPGFTLTAIAVLSLGIGANLAEIHIFEAFLHRLNVRDPESLCQFIRMNRQRAVSEPFSIPEVNFYRRNTNALSAVVSETSVPDVHHAQDSVELRCTLVTGNLFNVLGLTPVYGRLLDDRDDTPGAPPVTVLDYDYWQTRFGGDPAVVNRTIRLNDKPVQVVGISTFGGLTRHANLWLANSQYPYLAGVNNLLTDYGMRGSYMFGRLKPGDSLAAVQSEFRSLTSGLRSEQPQYVGQNEWLKVQPAGPSIVTERAAILALTTFILLVLLVLFSACANLGNMLLARGLARQREMQIRFSIGAGNWRLVRQLMTENLLLAALASVGALFVGRLSATILLRVTGAPSRLQVTTDWPILLAAAALALGATLAFGLAPALQIVRRSPHATGFRKILVSVQVAASCVLLILSSFLTRAIQQSVHPDLAFDPSALAVVDPFFSLHGATPEQARQWAGEITDRLRRVPGVEGASIVAFPPLRRPRIEHDRLQTLSVNATDPSYFAMMRLPLKAGKLFEPAEHDAAVVSESAARALWPNRSPLGRTVFVSHRNRTVVGVVQDSGLNLLTNPDSVEVYTAIDDSDVVNATILVRAAADSARISAALRSAATVPGIVPLIFTFQGLVDQHLSSIRNMVKGITSLAAVASLLSLLGVFGLLAFTVAQRTREIGVRMALGARRWDVLGVVLGQYTVPFGTGAVIGVAIAVVAIKTIRSTIYGFVSFDALSFALGLLVFAAVALLASIAPARRALRIDPSSALRYE